MIAPASSHSALVTMELHADGRCIPLAQLGHDFAIPVEATNVPPGEAVILLNVDGEVTRMPVRLGHVGKSTDARYSLLSIETLS